MICEKIVYRIESEHWKGGAYIPGDKNCNSLSAYEAFAFNL